MQDEKMLLNKISQIPTAPGIYQFKNDKGKLFISGKQKICEIG